MKSDSTISIYHKIAPVTGTGYKGSTDIMFRWKPVNDISDRFATASLRWYATLYRNPSIVSFGVVDVLDTSENNKFAQQRPALYLINELSIVLSFDHLNFGYDAILITEEGRISLLFYIEHDFFYLW